MVGRIMSKTKGPGGALAASQLCYAMLTTRLGLKLVDKDRIRLSVKI
jgi:hypothetical protein